jgi:hypothetical protein
MGFGELAPPEGRSPGRRSVQTKDNLTLATL